MEKWNGRQRKTAALRRLNSDFAKVHRPEARLGTKERKSTNQLRPALTFPLRSLHFRSLGNY